MILYHEINSDEINSHKINSPPDKLSQDQLSQDHLMFCFMGQLSNGTTSYDYRTNNHIEGWHTTLKKVVGKAHPNFVISEVMKNSRHHQR